MTTTSRIFGLCDRIANAIGNEPDIAIIVRSLLTVLTKELSLVACPECRANLADEIIERVPDMLSRANAAAERASAGEHAHTCH
jgi:hypothetical protein